MLPPLWTSGSGIGSRGLFVRAGSPLWWLSSSTVACSGGGCVSSSDAVVLQVERLRRLLRGNGATLAAGEVTVESGRRGRLSKVMLCWAYKDAAVVKGLGGGLGAADLDEFLGGGGTEVEFLLATLALLDDLVDGFLTCAGTDDEDDEGIF